MSDELDAQRSALGVLTRRLASLELRVAELEGRAQEARAGAEEREESAQPRADVLPQLPLALFGRTLLVLAGAYLVRAATDGQAWPAAFGVGLGLSYAAFWQWRADREARAGRRASAAFHALASSVIAFPLIWEATTRFALLSAAAAYMLLVGFFALGLAVTWRRQLVANAMPTTGLALATALALLHSTHDVSAALLALLAIVAGLEWLAGVAPRSLPGGLRWAAGFALDLVALLLLFEALHPAPGRYASPSLGSAAAILLALPLLYLASTALRNLGRGQPLTAFDVVQGAAAFLLGCGGAWRIFSAHGLSVAVPAAVTLLLAAICYSVAFLFVERSAGHGRSFYFYSSAGLLLALAGTSALGLGPGVSLAWDALGIGAALAGRLHDRMTLRVHGALFLAVAAVGSGLLAEAVLALGGRSTAALSVPAWLTVLAAGVGWVLLVRGPQRTHAGLGRTPQLVLALLVVLGLGKAMQLGLWELMASPLTADAGAAAVVRTALLAALALGLAGLARYGAPAELGWLVYPLVTLGGLKVLTEDLRVGRPATLVLSFALYGLVLMLAPRLLRARAPGIR